MKIKFLETPVFKLVKNTQKPNTIKCTNKDTKGTELLSETKVVDTLVLNECFYKQLHSFIFSLYLNAVNPPTPKSMLFVAKERLEVPKHNIVFGGWGWWYTRGGIGMTTAQKGAIL